MNNEADKLRKGDVVLNGYAVKGVNDLHIIVGSTSRKTGPYSTTRYYKTRCLYEGKMYHESLFPKFDSKLKKVGHIDYEKYISDGMKKIREDLEAL